MVTKIMFSLLPFPTPGIPQITLTGSISRQNDSLVLGYCLAGEIEVIYLPLPCALPSRRDELWKMTCFEFFLAIPGQPGYWEFNMSPARDWNVYRMDAYRRVGFREETSIQQLPFEVTNAAGRFTLDIVVDLSPLVHADQLLAAGITAVIQARDGTESFWALSHPASQPDFHLREGFTLTLAGQSHPSAQSAPGN